MNNLQETATEKQKKYILEMQEFSEYPLPYIDISVATKKECSDYINKWNKLSHESLWAIENGYN